MCLFVPACLRVCSSSGSSPLHLFSWFRSDLLLQFAVMNYRISGEGGGKMLQAFAALHTHTHTHTHAHTHTHTHTHTRTLRLVYSGFAQSLPFRVAVVIEDGSGPERYEEEKETNTHARAHVAGQVHPCVCECAMTMTTAHGMLCTAWLWVSCFGPGLLCAHRKDVLIKLESDLPRKK